ncbi:iron-siderophore ABC transporter substrate-binding protein [Buchananella hordeovulneris]|uniref:iron-siderophore ABC transporter substrate-binding protein n=1 Tax=Buchananella hordeovulneris TaxID=52770 RepID=UPI000F5FA365|nr:iron-siderophore ABC transporter substrate-binding protein [Buchananella hordeovulneris]RRD45080.1 iron-siderophore ABC transporter substrate-binding protein [Buchananella hordeovulneris]
MRLRTSALLLATALATVGCASQTDSPAAPTAAAASAAAPATIKHAFGETTIPAQVERVAAVNWANHDVPLALGVMPVGFAAQSWGVEDGSGMLAWTKEAVEKQGGKPVLFDETDGIDFEAVAATEPDVILAAYSGLTKEDYDKLSKIAPTVAYPTIAWGTPWRDYIKMNAAAINRAEDGEKLVADLEKQIATATAKFPQIAGKRAAFFYGSPQDLSKIGYYTTADPRTAFLADLGLAVPPSVAQASKASDSFFVQLSAEHADQLADIDLIVMYGTEADLPAYQADKLLGTIPAIKNGAVAFVGDNNALAASTNPSPLSIPWGLTQYLEKIAAAADKAK